jgi:hypothetical protein
MAYDRRTTAKKKETQDKKNKVSRRAGRTTKAAASKASGIRNMANKTARGRGIRRG